ncbi:UV DNA damage repair endonuclease UvsE [candidate division CSSED10-310 bacterium]|uniref:UV DNA damage repair endonuclease UvsE n=1 Tax=candidate division CSSED10-310 bacterium TaxID=2855610 RepID=A0ABV6Z300_UNCC1
MRIGYPCINRSIGCSANRSFRLKSYSEEKLIETVENNLDCLEVILRDNVDHSLLFFRISSDLVPFASHPVNTFPWHTHFQSKLRQIGTFIRENDIRISMHPDQFTLINSPKQNVHQRSVSELQYHARVLEAMDLDDQAKIQIHVGGIYGDKNRSKKRFVKRYKALDPFIRKRLVIENDDRCYHVQDCLDLHQDTGVPLLFDTFHHVVFNGGNTSSMAGIFRKVRKTWANNDGVPMVDYSSQQPGEKPGKHAQTIDVENFLATVEALDDCDVDIMLEIKDKEKSARKAFSKLQTFLSGQKF